MKLQGLSELIESLFHTKPHVSHWGMKAKNVLPQTKPATADRKKYRKAVQASKRRNRR